MGDVLPLPLPLPLLLLLLPLLVSFPFRRALSASSRAAARTLPSSRFVFGLATAVEREAMGREEACMFIDDGAGRLGSDAGGAELVGEAAAEAEAEEEPEAEAEAEAALKPEPEPEPAPVLESVASALASAPFVFAPGLSVSGKEDGEEEVELEEAKCTWRYEER